MTLPVAAGVEYSFPSEGKHVDSLLDSTARFNLWHGSVRSAKTITSAFRWFNFVTSDEVPPGVPLMMFGQTQETLRRNVIDPLADMFPGRVEWQAGLNQVRIGHRTVYAMGAGDVRAYRRIRGITLGGAYLDEASLVSEEFFYMLMSRLSVPGAKLFATTNPETPAHWLWRRWIKRAADLDMRVFHFLLDDNPWLDPGYVDNLKTEYIGVWYRRYILGQWVAAEGAIWPAFDPDLHVVDEVPAQLLRGRESIDYGTVNPLVDLLAGVGTGPDGKERIYITREWRWDSRERGQQLTDGQYSARLTEWRRERYAAPPWQSSWGGGPAGVTPERVLVDPSAASFIHQLQADSVAGVTGANNEVAYGLRSVGSLLAADRLRIHRSCQGLIEEMISYSWDEAAAQRGEEKPVKENDHGCLVAGTLVGTEHGHVRLDKVVAGDRVWTRAGLRTVVASGCTSISAPVFQVEFSDGRSLVGTGDHPIWVTGSGWVRLDALRYGMLVECESTQSPFGESPSAATPTPSISRTGSTTPQALPTRPGASSVSTRRFGRPPTGRFRKATRFITSTTTPSTMTCRTLSPFPSLTTRKSTGSKVGNGADASDSLRLLGSEPPNGIAPPKAAPGIGVTGGEFGRTANRSTVYVSNAEPIMRPSISARPGSALTTAEPPGDAPPVLTTSPVPAGAAGRPSPSTGTPPPGRVAVHVVAVTPAGHAPVFNLEVDGSPEFYANGVLVHNCDAARYLCLDLWPVWRGWLRNAGEPRGT